MEGGAGAPIAAVFPDGEGLAQDAGPRGRRGPRARRAASPTSTGRDAVWLACSHGDVIKSVLADALASHLDNFQRIVVDPCSISVVHYTPTRPFVVRVNDLGGDVAASSPRQAAAPTARSRSDVAAGGSDADGCGGTCRDSDLREPVAAARSTLDGSCPASSTSSASPSASSPGPSASPATAPSTCRRSRTPAPSACCWRSSRSRCSPSASPRCCTEVARRFGPDVPPVAGDPDADPLAVPAGGGVPGRHHGAGLGRRLPHRRHRAARRERGGGRRVGRPGRRRGGARRAAGVPLPGAGPGVRRARRERVVSAGRPPCPLCAEPLDPEGHVCVRLNGYHRRPTLAE